MKSIIPLFLGLLIVSVIAVSAAPDVPGTTGVTTLQAPAAGIVGATTNAAVDVRNYDGRALVLIAAQAGVTNVLIETSSTGTNGWTASTNFAVAGATNFAGAYLVSGASRYVRAVTSSSSTSAVSSVVLIGRRHSSP